jgi:D-glycero-alpha-D-manno-heptose-7-phosphate kinase
MIIVRSPLRISLGGGGTDLPSYYENFGCNLTTMAINKYIYVFISDTFKENTIIKYSKSENIRRLDQIKHPIIKEVFRYFKFDYSYKEIISIADIPAGTGLGSSGAFTVSLISALKSKMKLNQSNYKNAEDACRIEIDILKEPSGKQDQYISAYGGIKNLIIDKNGLTKMKDLQLSQRFQNNLIENSLLIFTGSIRRSSDILGEQKLKSNYKNSDMIKNLHQVKKFGFKIKKALMNEDLEGFGHLMHRHWEMKKERSNNMSNKSINRLYEFAMENGAIGGKLIGAGGGGFLYLICKKKDKIIKEIQNSKFNIIDYKIDHEGTRTILNNEKNF